MIFKWFIPVVCDYNIKYQNDISWVSQNTTLYYGVRCQKIDNMFRPFSIRPPCQNWWWPYRKGPKHVVYLLTPYTVIKCCVLTHPPDIILIFDIAMEWAWNWLGVRCTLTGGRYEILCQGLGKRKVCVKFVSHSLTDVQRITGIQLVKTSAKGGRDQLLTLFAWPCYAPASSRNLKWKPSFRKEDFRISRISRIMWPPNQLHFP